MLSPTSLSTNTSSHPDETENPVYSDPQDNGHPWQNDDHRLLTVKEAGSFLNISRSKVYEMMYAGEIESVRIDTARRITLGELRRYVRSLQDQGISQEEQTLVGDPREAEAI